MALANLTIEELSELVAKSIDKKLSEHLTRSQENSHNNQNHTPNNQNHTPNNHSPRYSGGYHPRYNNPRNTTPQYNTQYNTQYNNNNTQYNSHTPGGRFHSYSPTHKNNNYQPHYNNYRRPHHAIEPLKIMITYMETACLFWGQVLTPDLLDATRQLEQDLEEMCPGLPPLNHVTKAGMYATTWGGQWYRCITCHQADAEGNTEVLFVDYGNKEKKNVSELVGLRSPKLLDVPFFACPFRFPNMTAVPDKTIEEVGRHFDTESILTGFVSQSPTPDIHTDIYVIRPPSSSTDPPSTTPSSTTYNDLMLELGFAKKSEESTEVKPPQPGFFMRALQNRVRNLSNLCREKDSEIQRLGGGGELVQQSPGGPSQDIRYPAEPGGPSQDIRYPAEPTTPTYQSNYTPVKKSPSVISLSNGSVSEGVEVKTKLSQTDEMSVEDTESTVSVEGQFQEYLLSLIDKLKEYNSTAVQVMSSSDSQKVRFLYEQVVSASVNSDITELKTSVDSALETLTNNAALIPTCQNAKSLEAAVKNRDESLQMVDDVTQKYVKVIEGANLQDTIDRISSLITELNESATNTSTSQSTEELMESLDEVQGRHTGEVTALHKQCTEQLQLLNEQLISSSKLLNSNAISACTGNSVEELDKVVSNLQHSSRSERDNVARLGVTLENTRSLLEQLSTVTLHHADQITPIASKLQGTLLKKAKTKLAEMKLYVISCEEYRTKGLAARETLQNKPDMSALKEIKSQLKAAKRQVKLAQIKGEDSDEEEEGGEDANIRESMLKLHKVYQAEETELKALLQQARTTHPELLVEAGPQLQRMAKEGGLLRGSWELHEFVMPDTAACINNQGCNVYCGFYADQEVFFVERPLQSLEGDLEEQAVNLVKGSLPGCFAIILDKKSLKAFGATTEAPIN